MEFIIAAVIIAVLAVLFYTRRRENLHEVHKGVELKQEEKRSWLKDLSFGEVQNLQRVLKMEIEEKFQDEEKRNLLIESVTEWAELRIKTFEGRRSWVRKPEEHDVETSIKQSHGKIQH